MTSPPAQAFLGCEVKIAVDLPDDDEEVASFGKDANLHAKAPRIGHR